ncbi:MAG: TIR domain-containing protein [Xanthobacteraceae bacterium]
MTGKIFINYRRGDDPGHTGRLFDRLQDVFDPGQLFLDVDNIAPGLDFVRVLDERVAECDVVLAVIGKGWIDARDPAGARRLDDPDDFVRIEIVSALGQDKRVIPVLVGEAQMPRPDELPDALKPLARRNAVRLTHERFRADVQGLIKALQQALAEIDESRQRQAEAEAAQRAEAERLQQEAAAARRTAEEERTRGAEMEARQRASEEHRRREAENAQRVEEEERKRLAEIEAQQRASEERRRKEAETRKRADDERALAAARHAGTIAAVDAFLAVSPSSHVVDEAQKLRAELSVRADAHRDAMASDDAAVLRAFVGSYNRGADSDQVRTRLRQFAPLPARRLPPVAIVVPAALALAIAAGFAVWLENRPASNSQQMTATVAPPPQLAPANIAAPGAQATKSATPETKSNIADVAPVVPPPVAPAPPVTPPDQVAWDLVKDSMDPDQLQRFIAQFPNSAESVDARQRIASLAATSAKPVVPAAPDPHELARSLQFELQRVGCFDGAVNGEFDDATKSALHKFIKLTSISMPDEASTDAINAVRGANKRICPLLCPTGEHADGEACVANPAPVKRAAERAAPSGASTIQASPPPALGGRPCRNPRMHRLAAGGCGY